MTQPAQPIPPPDPLPRESGGFRLRREIGRGGMGVVYEAEEIASGRRVALKVLLQDLAVSGEAFERFQREARLAAAISHEHCVFVYGAHEIDGSPAIAMEIVDGETLEDTIRRGTAIPIETAVRWAIDVIDGLEAAHRAGILHRDVKPSNCFVTSQGRVKIGDFGLSRTLERDVELTQSGQFLGSPLYASPEQVRGRTLDIRSDLYSCGATLYAILSGKAPYTGSNLGEVLSRILSEPPPLMRSIRPEVPRALELIILRAMERDPDRRWRDLSALREALAPFATNTDESAAPWRRIGAYILDTGVLTLASGAIMVLSEALNLRVLPEGGRAGSFTSQLLLMMPTTVYFFVGEGFFGTTIGKWLLGLRVVSATTREKSIPGVAIRTLVFHGPSMVLSTALWLYVTDKTTLALAGTIGPFLILVVLFSTARRRNAWRGIHDIVSGTMARPVSLPFRWTRLQSPPPEIELQKGVDLPAQVGDYVVEGVVGRTSDGRILKARDSVLERSVWIHVPEQAGLLVGEERRSLSRPSRLRWLGIVQTPSGARDVFESPGGTSLSIFAARHGRLEWSLAQQMVLSLVRELEANGASDETYALEQVWIDRHWHLKLLDEPVGAGAFQRLAPMVLVREVSRALFVGTDPDAPVLPPDLPVHAELTVQRLLGTSVERARLSDVREALSKLSAGPAHVLRRTRCAQLSMNAVLPAAILGFVALLLVLFSVTITSLRGVTSMISELRSGRLQLLDPKETLPLTEDQRRVREILIVDGFASPWASVFEGSLSPEDKQVVIEVRARRKSPTRDEVNWAEAEVISEGGATAKDRTKHELESFKKGDDWAIEGSLEHAAVWTALIGVSAWGLLALPLAFAFRGGLTFTIFGIKVRDRRGRPAGRFRCLARCFLAWLPLLLGVVGTFALATNDHTIAALIAGSITSLVYVAAVVHAMLNPARCLVDRALGTRLVPR